MACSPARQFNPHKKHKPGDTYNPAAFIDQSGYDAAISDLQSNMMRDAGEAYGTLVACLGCLPADCKTEECKNVKFFSGEKECRLSTATHFSKRPFAAITAYKHCEGL